MNIVEQDVQGVPIESEEVAPNTSKERGTMYSRWHLLVNSNVPSGEDDQANANRIAAILKDSINCVFFEHAQEIFFSRIPGHKFEKPTVESVKIKMAAEIGSIQHRVHVHCIIDVVHHTILQINVRAMRLVLSLCINQRDPNLPFPYMHLKWIPVNQAIEKYIGKAPVGLQ